MFRQRESDLAYQRQIDICCQKYIRGEYRTLKDGASHLPFSPQMFGKYVAIYKEKYPAPGTHDCYSVLHQLQRSHS
jgi:hypothetical protein